MAPPLLNPIMLKLGAVDGSLDHKYCLVFHSDRIRKRFSALYTTVALSERYRPMRPITDASRTLLRVLYLISRWRILVRQNDPMLRSHFVMARKQPPCSTESRKW